MEKFLLNTKKLKVIQDKRGTLFNPIDTNMLRKIKHFFIATIKPNEIRGGHYHLLKTEWLILLNGKAQLIFSSHSFNFMNKLDMHQINLVQKNSKSESLVYSLNQVEGIRSDDNFLNKYMTGTYGAFPKIRV